MVDGGRSLVRPQHPITATASEQGASSPAAHYRPAERERERDDRLMSIYSNVQQVTRSYTSTSSFLLTNILIVFDAIPVALMQTNFCWNTIHLEYMIPL